MFNAEPSEIDDRPQNESALSLYLIKAGAKP